MSWFNRKIIASLFPAYALKRAVAENRLNRLHQFKSNRRGFDAISGNRLRSDILHPKNSADSAISSGIEGLRQHVRQLEYNNGFVSGPIQRIVNNVVGTGFQFQSRVKPDDSLYASPFPTINEKTADLFNVQRERAFKRWSKQADKRLVCNFNELLRLAEGALIRDGEVLAIGRESKRKDRIIPYCLDLLEIDRLSTPMEEINNLKIRNGIRFDEEGVPETYFVLKNHPGDSMAMSLRRGQDYEEVPAFNRDGTRKVIHLFNPLRPEQSRGFSAFASALKNLQDLDRYQEAEIYAALEDACLTGIVTTQAPDVWQANYTSGNLETVNGETTAHRTHEFAPGKWHYMEPGESVEIHGPKRPNDALGEMVNQLLRGPANALDIPPEIIAQNWQSMNYSNARTVLLMFYTSMRVRQKYLIDHFCFPVDENFTIGCVIHGVMKAPGFDSRRADYVVSAWIPPGWQWVDPVKEAKGKEIEVQNNFDTLANIAASRGTDWEEQLEQRAREISKQKELEEKYGIEFPKAQSKPDVDSSTEEEPEDNKDPQMRVVK